MGGVEAQGPWWLSGRLSQGKVSCTPPAKSPSPSTGCHGAASCGRMGVRGQGTKGFTVKCPHLTSSCRESGLVHEVGGVGKG